VRVEVVHCDLGNTEDVKTVFPRALDLMGGEIDVFVNCAGIQRRDQAVKFSETDWDDVSPFSSFGSSLFSSVFYVPCFWVKMNSSLRQASPVLFALPYAFLWFCLALSIFPFLPSPPTFRLFPPLNQHRPNLI